MGNVLHTEGLTKTYGGKKVVNNINMDIDKGDIYGFIGKNGAGKTTFMRLILDLAIPDSGSILLFNGMDRKQAGQKMGSIIEAPALYTGCTSLENLKRFAIISGSDAAAKTDSELLELIDLVGLTDAGNKKVGHYSLGMKQRLGLAIAMLGDPEFMVMDEPVNGLDPAGIKDIRDAIRNLNHEKGVTFLISSHLLDELSRIVTRYGIINDGVLVEEITAHDIENKFRENITLTTDNPQGAVEVLGRVIPLGEVVVNGETITIYDHTFEPAAINRILVTNNISVSSLNAAANNIEDYFIERIGG